MTERVDGHEVGTAESSYFARGRQEREVLTRARMPMTIKVALVAGTVAGLSILLVGVWPWFSSDPRGYAADVIDRSGLGGTPAVGRGLPSKGQITLMHILVFTLLLAGIGSGAWAGVVAGVARGAEWLRRVGVLVAAATVFLCWLALSGGERYAIDRWLITAALVGGAVALPMLLVPNREWFDWRRHGKVVPKAAPRER